MNSYIATILLAITLISQWFILSDKIKDLENRIKTLESVAFNK
jgi:hypothetical protein